VLIVAKPPLLAGLTHQLQSLWNAPETVDASCPEEFKEWLAAAAGRASLSDEEKAAVADRRARTGVSDALIIDAQLLPPAELAKLPYKRIITLSPPRQVKEASTSITVGEDLMRPVTRRTLREVLTVATERDAAGQLKAGSQHQQQQQEQDEGHARQGNSPFLVLVVDDNKVNQKVQSPHSLSAGLSQCGWCAVANMHLTRTRNARTGRGRNSAALGCAL
jgi:hypothetical protein